MKFTYANQAPFFQRSLFGLLLTASAGAFAECEEGERYLGLARKAGAEQEYAQATLWLERSLNSCESYEAWHLQGIALQKQSRLGEALEAYSKAVQFSPDTDSAAISSGRYGQVLAQNGQRFEALTMLERAMEMHSDPPDWIRRSAKEIDLNIADQPITRESIRRSLSNQEFGLLSYAGSGRGAGNGQAASLPKVKIGIPINFEFNSVNPDALTKSNLAQLGAVLSDPKYQNNSFTLIGHSDVRGSEAYNFRLSEDRAEAIEKELVDEYPVLKGRLMVNGAGETRPKYRGSNTSEDEHRLNRRLEVFVN